MGLKIQIPTADLKATFQEAIVTALSAEKALAADAQVQVQQLIDDLYPLIVAETQNMIKSPTVAQGYLAVLQGIVEATTARLGLVAIATQKQQVAAVLQTAIQVLSLCIKAAMVVA